MPDHPSILETINTAQSSPIDKVTVFPFMCGSGKATAIKQKIKEVILSLEQGSRDGMIIITDTILGLKSYAEPKDDKEQYDFAKHIKTNGKLLRARTRRRWRNTARNIRSC